MWYEPFKTHLGMSSFGPVWTRKRNLCKLMQPEKNRGTKVTLHIGNPRKLQRSKGEVTMTFTRLDHH